MSNTLDKQYTDLLQTILDYGVEKKDRTGTGTKSIFGYTIRHNMKNGFPLLTTKKMAWKTMVTELLWFLRGDTNIKYLVDNNCHIWDGDAYKNYLNNWKPIGEGPIYILPLSQEEFINKIKTDDKFAKKWGELGPVYGKQWRKWGDAIDLHPVGKGVKYFVDGIDQIANLIRDLKTNPDSRRLMVSAWNVGEINQMVLPPCHYGFQVYTRELSFNERIKHIVNSLKSNAPLLMEEDEKTIEWLNNNNVPTRAISLMWNQRSVDTFLGLPFNIASYGLLLEIIAKVVNMVPDELIGNLGDVHLYSNHVEQATEQIGRELTKEERKKLYENEFTPDMEVKDDEWLESKLVTRNIPKRTREPYPLPNLTINTEFWPYEGGECGVGPIDAMSIIKSFSDDNFCRCLLEEDIQLSNYQSHPTIKAPLSN